MLHFLPPPILGALSFLFYLLNTLFWAVPIFTFTILRFIIPYQPWLKFCRRMLDRFATNWISVNGFHQKLTNRTRIIVEGVEGLKPDEWYLVLSNHQSWVDILVLQKIFNRKIPFLKFFIKKQLFRIPVIGQIWWALDFPFMERYSSEFLKKNPHLKGKDFENTRKACEKFKQFPVSVMNFVEGTRFTEEKHRRQQSPFTYLLKPKAGGTASVLAAMGGQLHRILNITIVYPYGEKTFWKYLCGKVEEIRVQVVSLPIGDELVGDYNEDSVFRTDFQNWINGLWEEKDKCIHALLHQNMN